MKIRYFFGLLLVSVSISVFGQLSDQTITFAPIPGGNTYGSPGVVLVATATSGLVVTFSSSNSQIGQVIGNQLFFTGAGEVTITARQAGNSSFNPAIPVSQRIFVQKAEQTISFPPLATKTFGNAAFLPGASTSSSLPVTYTSSDPAIASIVGDKVQINRAGEVQITAKQPGNSLYFPATSVTQTLIIQKSPQWVVILAPTPKTYGDEPFTLVTQTASSLPVTWIRSQHDSVAEVNGSQVTIRGAGSTLLSAYQSGDDRFLPGSGTYLLTVSKKSQTITFDPLPPSSFGAGPILLNALASSGLPVIFRSSRNTIATVAGNSALIHSAGSTNIVASQAGDANYLPAPDVIRNLTASASVMEFSLTGTTLQGGNGSGTVFNIETSGANMTTTHMFPPTSNNLPNGGLIKGSDGKLYGVISAGGVPAFGVIFSMNADGTGYTVIHNFNNVDGAFPTGSLMEASNGYLYGVTRTGGPGAGVIYRINKDGTDFSVLHGYNGSAYNPVVGLVQAADGKLYGATPQGGIGYGALYAIHPDGTGFTNIVEFNGPVMGSSPMGVPVQGGDQSLYGVTSGGGNNGKGVIYKVSTDGTNYTVLHHFDGTDGSHGSGSLTLGSNGKLFGMTQRGGVNDKGTLFSILPNGTAFTKLLDFDGSALGAIPLGSLIESAHDGDLYGITSEGGSSGLGVCFRVKKDGTGFIKLLDFNGTNGANPWHGPLLETSAGIFMGLAYRGGASDAGLIYSITSGGVYGLLKDFPQPASRPITLAGNDNANHLVGILSGGGTNGAGALFTVDPDGSNSTTLFDLPGGNFPFANKLMVASDQSIWGIGREGVSSFTYFLFRLNGDGTGYQRIDMNDPSIGVGPVALVDGRDGYVYGAASNGGTADHGTIFRLHLNGTGLTRVVDFPGGSEGARPNHLIRHSTGLLYGLTEGSGSGATVVFRILPGYTYEKVGTLPEMMLTLTEINGGSLAMGTSTKLLTYDIRDKVLEIVFSFLSPVGTYVQSITQTLNGYLVVALREGGLNGYGSIVKMLPDGTGFTKLVDFNSTNGSGPNALQIIKEVHQITDFVDIPEKQFLDPPFLLEVWTNSGAPVLFRSTNPAVAEVDGYRVTIKGVGSTTIRAIIPASGSHKESMEIQKNLTVVKSDHGFSFAEIAGKKFGDPDFRLTTTSDSGLPVSFTSSDEAVATLSGNRVSIVGAGITTITASIQQSPNFNDVSPIQRAITVLKRDQQIQVDRIGAHYVDASPFPINFVNPSGLPVSFSSGSPAVATVSGPVVTPLSAGQSLVTARAFGDANHNDSEPVERDLVILKHDQELIFDAISDKQLENSTFEFFPPRSSFGLPVDLTTTSANISISGTVVTLNAAGRATLKANQPGTSSVSAAAEVARTFCILPAQPTVTLDTSTPGAPVLTSSSSTGNEWLKNGVLISGANGQTYTPAQSGNYAVQVNVDGCISTTSVSVSAVVVGLQDEISLVVYPNPAHEKLYVSLPPSAGQASVIGIHDLLGKLIRTVTTNEATAEVDIASLPSGFYLVKVTQGGSSALVRVVKQ